jgi:CheY-like chemotaxis protein
MSDFSKHTILVVDDEPDNLEVFKAALEMLHNATVHVASGGDEALSLLSAKHFTLIVTDLSMPRMDGYALLHLLRNRPDVIGLPIIAITAHAMLGDRERIMDAGFDGYISKPFDIATLADDIDVCLTDFNRKRGVPAEQVRMNGVVDAA